MNYVGGAERIIQALEASGISGSLVHWERLIVISYVTLVGRGSNIVDVGGKKGRHVAVFLDHLRADRVYVFEPNPDMCAILHRRYGARRNLTISETALADHSGVEEFTVNLGAPGESGLRPRIFSNPDRTRVERIKVAVARLDDQVFDGPIRYVKIDVEGGEIGVLRGGRDFLARDRPLLSVESVGRATPPMATPPTRSTKKPPCSAMPSATCSAIYSARSMSGAPASTDCIGIIC